VLRQLVEEVKKNARRLSSADGAMRTELLHAFATELELREREILSANEDDLRAGEASLSPNLLGRLALSPSKLADVVRGIRRLAEMPDPLGRVQFRTELDAGLVLDRVSVPLGVVAVVFESRPDVLPQVAALALRTGNGVVMKGGREAEATNHALFRILSKVLSSGARSPAGCALLVDTREEVRELLAYSDLIDLVIPRGSNELVRSIMESSKIPVMGHAAGVCHLYVHRSANQDEARALAIDAKTQYPSACNSIETIVVDAAIAEAFLPKLAEDLRNREARLLGCAESARILGLPAEAQVTEWSVEYGDLTVALKVVQNLDAAIDHINLYGSHHTDAISASDTLAVEEFLRRVDSACVFSNCSTRFADGYRFGFGAEVGISTGKIHARGPVGIEGLLSYKYEMRGSGQIVKNYLGQNARPFTHRRIPLP
jgi:glutamate-5-semialdehyde dehydrogenase